MSDRYAFVMAKSQSFYMFSISISGESASYFIQMIILISLEYTLALTRMVFGRVTLPSKGAIRSKYVFLTCKVPWFKQEWGE